MQKPTPSEAAPEELTAPEALQDEFHRRALNVLGDVADVLGDFGKFGAWTIGKVIRKTGEAIRTGLGGLADKSFRDAA